MLNDYIFNPKLLITFTLLIVGPLGCAPVITKTTPDFIEPVTSMEFVFVEAGTFNMGNAHGDKQRELPVHEVALEGMVVGMYEVTFAQYDEFCEATGRKKPDGREWGRTTRPAINVTWDEANAYALWLSEQSGLNFSLPSESQWEYFARAGTTGKYWTGRKLPQNTANCAGCGSQWDNKKTAPVGSFGPNPWGIYDTAGNVAEWTMDDWHKGYEKAPVDGSAWFGSDGKHKVYRGGSWNFPVDELGSATRDWSERGLGQKTVGFRLVLNDFPIPVPKIK